jgi:hypothetical protein
MPIRVQDAPVDVTVQLMVSAAISGWVQFIGPTLTASLGWRASRI